MKRNWILGIAAMAIAGSLLAHPHFNKTVTAKLSDAVSVTISYNSTDANMDHVNSAEDGAFLRPRNPSIKFSADSMSGSTKIAAGEYTVGVIKTGDGFTMGLYPGKVARGTDPDMSKIIRLDSMFSDSMGTAEHMLIDVTAGHGKFAGKPILTIHFASLFLAAAIG